MGIPNIDIFCRSSDGNRFPFSLSLWDTAFLRVVETEKSHLEDVQSRVTFDFVLLGNSRF